MCQGVVKNGVKKGRRQLSSEDSDSDSTPTKPLQVRGLRNRDPIDLRIAIDLDAAECAKKDIPCWKDSHAGPSSLPARRICVTCGFFGDYKCVSCVTKRITRLSVYYCSNVCYEIHKDHSCGKPINATMW